MRALFWSAIVVLVGLQTACNCGSDEGPLPDAGVVDDASADARSSDGAPGDGSTSDGATGDGATSDGATSDGTIGDGSTSDGGTVDATPTLSCLEVNPQAGHNAQQVRLTLRGLLFEQLADVELIDLVSKNVIKLTGATVSDTDNDQINDKAEIDVPALTPQGGYAVWIINPTSGARAECGTYSSVTDPPPQISNVTPSSAWAGNKQDSLLSDQQVTISGSGFQAVPTVVFVAVQGGDRYVAPSVSFVSSTSLNTICPTESQGMPTGDYHVEVINPNQLAGRWMVSGSPGVFKVKGTAPPTISDMTPFKVSVSESSAAIKILGENFDPTAELFILMPDGSLQKVTATVTVNAAADDEIDFTFDNGIYKLTVGIYPLRVVNADGQFDTYFSLQVENSAPGKLNADNWVKTTTLLGGRERAGASNGFDVFGNAYIYVVGGSTAGASLATRPRPILQTTEIVAVDVFGQAAAQAIVAEQLDPSVNLATFDPRHDPLRRKLQLNSARSGLGLVRVGAYLFAIGGAASDADDPAQAGQVAALDTVERAKILGYDTRPQLARPSVGSAAKGLPRGSWTYQVSAIGPWGESLPSRAVMAQNVGGVFTLRWLPASGATSYLIYRSPSGDGRAGATRLLKANVTGNSFVDDGQQALAPAPGRLSGTVQTGGTLAVGSWTYRVTAVLASGETVASYPATLTTTSGSQTIGLAWNPIPNATYRVYRGAAVDQQQTYLLDDSVTATAYTDDGSKAADTNKPAPLGTEPLLPGSLSWWTTLSDKLSVGREGVGTTAVVAVDGNPTTANDPTYIYAIGGRKNNARNATYLATGERLKVDPQTGQASGGWQLLTDALSAPIAFNTARAYYALISSQGRNVTPVAPPPPAPPCPDDDGDGFANCACGGQDCNDQDATVYPGASEICSDGKDQDCDSGCNGGTDLVCTNCQNADADGDGFDRKDCGGTDCNDNDKTICPDATKCPDTCGDGIDQDCDGKDAICTCPIPDKDGDGFAAKNCGGNDCDDNDKTICPDATKCPERNCDGIDQDCSGRDQCLVKILPDPVGPFGAQATFSAGTIQQFSTTFYPPSVWMTAFSGPGFSEDPVYLIAINGDDAIDNGTLNGGLTTAEVALVNIDGTITPWTVQTETTNVAVHGNDGLFIGDFVFAFSGVIKEEIGKDPTQVWNNVFRFEVNSAVIGTRPASVPADFLLKGGPAAASMVESRCYLRTVRLNAFIFGIGGNGGNGVGPLDSIERIKQ